MTSQRRQLAADLAQLYAFMSPARRRKFVTVLVLMVLGAVAELATIGAVVPFLSLLAGQTGQLHFRWPIGFFDTVGAHSRGQQLIAASILFMIAAVLAGALRLQLAWSTQKFVLTLGHELAVEIQHRTLAQPYSYHISRNSSEIIASLEKVQILVSSVILQLMQATTAAFISVFIVLAMVQIDLFTAAVATLSFGVIYGLVMAITRKKLAQNSTILGHAYEQRVQIIQESLGAIRDVIIDDLQALYLEEFRKADFRLTGASAVTAFIGSAPRFIIEAAGMVFIALLALAISGREGGFTQALPILGAVALGTQRLLPLIQQLYQSWTNLAGNRSIAAQVLDLLALPVDQGTLQPAPLGPVGFDYDIRFDNVSFTYPGRHRPALENVNLTIASGSHVALVGQTGSGKSTLADLLMGLLEPAAGAIFVDGVALTRQTRRAWQRSIAHVPQEIFLADTTIARNIAFGVPSDEIDFERVVRAAAIAQLDDFIASLPERYGTSVGERGVGLSGGQRQRLGIARAIYKDAPVLVFDEATSALDNDTEMAVMSALDQHCDQGRTIIVIAHRHSRVEHCELVARLENGRLVAVGTFAQVYGAKRAARTRNGTGRGTD